METKKCTKCGEVKAVEFFYRKGCRCKVCIKAQNAEAYALNPEKFNTCSMWAKAHPEKARAKAAAWKKANHEKYKEKAAAWTSSLPASYVAKRLRIPVAECPPELIAIKREQIQLRRLTKQLNQVIKDAQK